MKVSSMKTALSPAIWESGWTSSTLTNCGRKAKKKIESLGFRMLIRIAWTVTWSAEPASIIGPKSVTYHIDFNNPDSLKGKIVGVQISTAHARFMDKYFGSAVTIKTYDTQDNVNADLVAGRIDLEMADAVNLAEFLKTDEGRISRSRRPHPRPIRSSSAMASAAASASPTRR
jgi:ABC-type amino acid transport substrate-binding protein